MTPDTFQHLASQGFNRIPVTCSVLADLDTPLSAYIKLADEEYSCLLESVKGGERWGRWSIIGMRSQTILKITGHHWQLEEHGQITEQRQVQDPLAEIAHFLSGFRVPELPELPRFHGGLVGYFSYDTVRYVEPRLSGKEPPDTLNTPDILLMLMEDLVVFDNLKGRALLVTYAHPDEPDALARAHERLEERRQQLKIRKASVCSASRQAPCPPQPPAFDSQWGETGFKAAVNKIKDYIVAGDVMQVVLSQRMSQPWSAPPLDLYRALRSLNPSPYMYFLNLKDFHVVGSSPEILGRLESGSVAVRPLAGTRRRGTSPEQDKALEQELLADPKERAEHLMLIDLGRNDIGRIAETGSVKLEECMQVERYSHVMHIVSHVSGQLKKGLTMMDALSAVLPAGTLSGAPKIRAMEIIDELEPVKRGIYGGAVGYLGWNGNMDTAIAIRTAVIKDQQLYIQAGAGVVADSQPDLEWQETLNKGQALFQAVHSLASEF
ncbi:MAG: anthranilate synthase component I [Kistimonas sp.]|nr:anthranilate synthase component I [Kistimonas sp.]